MPVSESASVVAVVPSKRKLQEYAPHDATMIACRRPSPPSSSSSSFDPCLSASSSSSSSSSSLSSLHFFVRSGSKSFVLHTNPDATVHSILLQIHTLYRFPVVDVRLIHSGRQLDHNRTLASYGISNDSILHLVFRLRSTNHPRAWQIVNDLIYAASCLDRGGGSFSSRPLNVGRLEDLAKQFLDSTPSVHEKSWGHLFVFVSSGAPQALVKLLFSPLSDNRLIADKAIRLFLDYNSDHHLRHMRPQLAGIVLEFCKLLRGAVGLSDKLYRKCRLTLGSMLCGRDGVLFNSRGEPAVILRELYPFLDEIAEKVRGDLSKDAMVAEQEDVAEFSDFVSAIRNVVCDLMGGKRSLPRRFFDVQLQHPDYDDLFRSFYLIFIKLLDRVGKCLAKIDEFLVLTKLPVFESRWICWGDLLVILTKLHKFSKIFEGSERLLHTGLFLNRVSVNELIKRAKRNQKLRWLLKYKDVTDFEARSSLMLMLFPDGKDEYDELLEMLIDRSHLLAESFEYIGKAEASALHGALFMEFKNEEATGPGVLREWFYLLCRAIFNPQNVLFSPCPREPRRFFPNSASAVNQLHLEYFRFCGRVVALALMHKVQVGVMFDRLFFLQLAGKTVTLDDIQEADPFLYMSCKKILEMDAELLDSDVLGLTFVREFEELGSHMSVELVPGGRDIVVDSRNRDEYVKLLVQHRFVTSISEQVYNFGRGFGDLLIKDKYKDLLFSSLELEDLDQLLGGDGGTINMKDWKAHTEYNGYKAKDRQISWFWKVVEGMPAEQQRVLLFFWASVKHLPADGFCGLGSKLYIYRAGESQDHLPTSQTCFYRLCLPPYPSMSIMRERLRLITQEHVSCSFGLW